MEVSFKHAGAKQKAFKNSAIKMSNAGSSLNALSLGESTCNNSLYKGVSPGDLPILNYPYLGLPVQKAMFCDPVQRIPDSIRVTQLTHVITIFFRTKVVGLALDFHEASYSTNFL